MTEHIVLLGLMGAGKSTVGTVLARRLGWELRDSDPDIEAITGRTVRELKEALGVDEMHRLEANQLIAALSRPEPSVVCAAASVVDEQRCRVALAAPSVLAVWLKLAPAALAARFASEVHRPSYGNDPQAFLAAQLAARGDRFRSLAKLQIDTDGLEPEAVAAAILAQAPVEIGR